MKNIVLIGFMGTGKTSIGRLLATRLRRPFIDTDRKIEIECGMSISEIFKIHGEAYFREQEAAVIAKVSRYTNTIISTGGGVVTLPRNISRLKSNGLIIELKASLETIIERTGRRNARPLLNCDNPEQVIADLLKKRQPLYNVADYSIDTNHSSPNEIIETIIAFARQGGYLRGRN